MSRKPTFIAAVVGLVATLASTLIAQDLPVATTKAPKDLLTAVPGNAWAALCVPKLSGLEGKLTTFAQQLNLPAPGSPLQMAKMMLQLVAGVNDDGGLAIVLMPTTDISSIGRSVVVLVPTTDYTALTAGLSPEPVKANISRVYLMGKPSYIAPYGAFAAIAQSEEVLEAVLKETSTLKSRLHEHQLKRMAQDDLTVWVNLEAVTSGELYAGVAPMLEMHAPGAAALKDLRSAQLSLRIAPTGLTIGAYFDAKPDSEIGKTMSESPKRGGSLLAGLPATRFAFAVGAINGKHEAEYGADSLDATLKIFAETGGAEAKILGELRPVLISLGRSMRGGALSVYPIAEGGDGIIGVHAVLNTEGAAKDVCKALAELVATAKKATAGDSAAALAQIQYSPAKERIAGTPVDHLFVELPKDTDAKTAETVAKIVGKDGLLIRIAAVDRSRVAITFGGGAAAMSDLCKTIKSGDAPLAKDEGIMRAAERFPASRNSEAYLALDRMMKLVAGGAQARGEPFPYTLDPIATPFSMVKASTGNAGQQTDIHVPMEVIVAVKGMVESAIGLAGMGDAPAKSPGS